MIIRWSFCKRWFFIVQEDFILEWSSVTVGRIIRNKLGSWDSVETCLLLLQKKSRGLSLGRKKSVVLYMHSFSRITKLTFEVRVVLHPKMRCLFPVRLCSSVAYANNLYYSFYELLSFHLKWWCSCYKRLGQLQWDVGNALKCCVLSHRDKQANHCVAVFWRKGVKTWAVINRSEACCPFRVRLVSIVLYCENCLLE